MSAPKGNRYWENRKKHGKPKNLKNPQELWGVACDYFQRCDDNPWMKVEHKGSNVERVETPTAIPYTWDGLENYLFELNFLVRLDDYKVNKDGRYEDYADIIKTIGQIIRDRKMTGAIVGAYNSNIIARELGLVDKKEQKIEGVEFYIGGDGED